MTIRYAMIVALGLMWGTYCVDHGLGFLAAAAGGYVIGLVVHILTTKTTE